MTQKEKLSAVLRFLKEAQPSQSIRLLPPHFGQLQTLEQRPGFGQAGTDQWQWHVWSFSLLCPPFDREKDAIVTFTLALHSAENVTPVTAFRIWQLLLEITRLCGVVEGTA